MALGRAKLAFTQGLSVWVLEAPDGFGDADVHAHHAIQISMGLSGPLRLCADEGPWREHRVALVRPHRRHRFDGSGETVAQIFVEPETAQGRALLQQADAAAIVDLPGEAIQPLLAQLLASFNGDAPDAALVALSQRIVATLCGQGAPALGVDPRIATLLPCNVVVRVEHGRTVVEALDPAMMADVSGVPELAEVADDAARRIQAALDAVAAS